jgi:ketosteroid isomerase-like protein
MTDTTTDQVAGVTTRIDMTAATPAAVRQVAGFYHDKAARDVDASIENFHEEPFVYIDATLGTQFPTREVLRGLLGQGMPTWPESANSYLTRVIGDENSAIVYFTNDPGIFFPVDMRSVSAVNFIDGKIARWIDYWDANHIGAANLQGWRHPQEEFPTDFGESQVGEVATGRIRETVAGLDRALAAHDVEGAAALFAPDATFSDLPSHIRVTGPRHIMSFLTNAQGALPYLGHGVQVRHVLGGDQGGGYEWTAKDAVKRGITAITLDTHGKITSLEAMWDGSQAADDTLIALSRAALEH